MPVVSELWRRVGQISGTYWSFILAESTNSKLRWKATEEVVCSQSELYTCMHTHVCIHVHKHVHGAHTEISLFIKRRGLSLYNYGRPGYPGSRCCLMWPHCTLTLWKDKPENLFLEILSRRSTHKGSVSITKQFPPPTLQALRAVARVSQIGCQWFW